VLVLTTSPPAKPAPTVTAVSPAEVTYVAPSPQEFSTLEVAPLAAPLSVLYETDILRPSARKSAAECHSTPRAVEPAIKSRPVGALLVVVPATPISPAPSGTEISCVPRALPAFNNSRADPSVKVSLRALSSSPISLAPSSITPKLLERVVPASVVSLKETLKFDRSTTF
jgi:hypothetical protein